MEKSKRSFKFKLIVFSTEKEKQVLPHVIRVFKLTNFLLAAFDALQSLTIYLHLYSNAENIDAKKIFIGFRL